jgi:hypothetical protein
LAKGPVAGQSPDRIRVRNPSFDAYNKHFVIPPDWMPHSIFLAGVEPKQLRLTRFYRESEPSHHGDTHIALAAYRNGIRENVGQRLKYPMIRGHQYAMDIWCAWSPRRSTVHPILQEGAPEGDLSPLRLQLFGLKDDGAQENILLAETPPIDHPEWRRYTLAWTCPGTYRNLFLVATWKADLAYDGNVLVDDLSAIRVTRMPPAK